MRSCGTFDMVSPTSKHEIFYPLCSLVKADLGRSAMLKAAIPRNVP